MPDLFRSQLRRHHNLLAGAAPISGPIVDSGRTAGKRIGGLSRIVGHRYWGISIAATNEQPVGTAGVAELEFFDRNGALISKGKQGFAKAGWTAVSGQTANAGLSDGLTSPSEGAVSYSGGSLPFILWMDFGSPVAASLMRVVGFRQDYAGGCPKDYSMVYSDDAVTWTVAASTTGQTNWQNEEDRILENPANPPAWTGQQALSSTQWRIRLEDYYEFLFNWSMAKLEFYESIGGAKVVPSGIAATSSASGRGPEFLIDDSTDTCWVNASGQPQALIYITATFASPIKVAQIGMMPQSLTSSPADIGKQMPKETRVEYLDGGTWKYAGYLIDPAPSYAAKFELRKYPLLISR